MNISVHRWHAVITYEEAGVEKTLVIGTGDGDGLVTFDSLEEYEEWYS